MTAICRIQSDGASLAALMAGERTSVVFLHTAVCDKRLWQHQMKAVAASGQQLVVYDRRGM